MKISPCMNCKEREVNCHSNCVKYKEYREKIKKKNKRIAEDTEYFSYREDVFKGGRM